MALCSDIKICSVNCRGLGAFEKKNDVFNSLRTKSYSMYMLQDTPNSDQPDFYYFIIDKIKEFGNTFYLIPGDFNLILQQSLDSYNYKNVNNARAGEKSVTNVRRTGFG